MKPSDGKCRISFGGFDGPAMYGTSTAVSLIGTPYNGVEALRVGMVRAGFKVRKSYARALTDMMMFGIGYFRPGPDTIETAPDLECWSRRDQR